MKTLLLSRSEVVQILNPELVLLQKQHRCAATGHPSNLLILAANA